MPTFNLPSSVFGVVLAVSLTACGKSTPAPPKPKAVAPAATIAARPAAAPTKAAPGAPTPSPAPARAAFHINAVTLGSAVDGARHISKPATQFVPDDKTIYASVASTGVTQDTALNARWSYLEGAGQLISSVTQRLASDGAATTTFTLHNPDLWPEGKYKLQISVDGKVVDTSTFTISK